MSFNEDKGIGELVEKQFASAIAGYYDTIEITNGYFPDYDVICEKTFDWIYPLKVIDTYEVKADKLHSITGNIAIEFMYNNSLSGISTTKATHWVQATDTEFLIFDTKQLKDWIRDSWKYLMKLQGGDDNKSSLIIISDKDIKKLPFIKIIKR